MAIEPLQSSASLELAYADTFRRLQRMFRARGLSREDAADLAQETALRVLRFLNGPDAIVHEADLRPLINRVATNLLIDRIRQRRHLVPIDDALHLEARDADPADVAGRREKRRAVLHATRELPERQRMAIALSLDGESPAEIAARLGIERNAADALLHRARRSLALRLRTLRTELHGIAVLTFLKLRGLSHRHEEQHAVLAASGGAQIAAALAVVLVAGTPAAAPPAAQDAPLVAARTAIVERAPAPRAGTPATVAAAPAPERRPEARAAKPAYRLEVDTGVDDPGGDEDVGIAAWWERGTERGVSGPVLDAAAGAFCSTAPAACRHPGGER